MSTFLTHKFLLLIIAFILLDLLAVGGGMGIPFFAILLGFGVGWFAPSLLAGTASNLRHLLRKCLMTACFTSAFPFLLMRLIWGPIPRMLFDPLADIANFGIPLIQYEPRASVIGWLVLMILISPFLQILTAGIASSVRLAWFPPAPFGE